MTDNDKHAREIAVKCVRDARRLAGDGWSLIGDELRWGLVCAGILSVIAGQHAMEDEHATEAAKARVAEYALALWRAAHEIKDNGWKASR